MKRISRTTKSILRLPAIAALLMAFFVAFPALAQADKPLVYAMYADIKDWDPSIASSTEVILLSNIYEPLIWYNPNGGKPIFTPALATDWSVSKDGKTWTFHLRKNVKFHDGTSFDAQG